MRWPGCQGLGLLCMLLCLVNGEQRALQPETAVHAKPNFVRSSQRTGTGLRDVGTLARLSKYQAFLERNEKLSNKLSEAFASLDHNHNGNVDASELKLALNDGVIDSVEFHLLRQFDLDATGISESNFRMGPLFVSVLELHPTLDADFAAKASEGPDATVPDIRHLFKAAISESPEHAQRLAALVEESQTRRKADNGQSERPYSHLVEPELVPESALLSQSESTTTRDGRTLAKTVSSAAAVHRAQASEIDWEADSVSARMAHAADDVTPPIDEHDANVADLVAESLVAPDITRPSTWRTSKPGYVEPMFAPDAATMAVERAVEAEKWRPRRERVPRPIADMASSHPQPQPHAPAHTHTQTVHSAETVLQQHHAAAEAQPEQAQPESQQTESAEAAEQSQQQQAEPAAEPRFAQTQQGRGIFDSIKGSATGAITGTKSGSLSDAQKKKDAALPTSKFGVPSVYDEGGSSGCHPLRNPCCAECVVCQYTMQRATAALYGRLSHDPTGGVGGGGHASATPDPVAMRDTNSQILSRFGGKGLTRIVLEDTLTEMCSSQRMPELFYSACKNLWTKKKTLLECMFYQYSADAACEEAEMCTIKSYFNKATSVHLPKMSKQFNSGRGTCGMKGGAHSRAGLFGSVICAGAKMLVK